jgi:hypothetical protein
VPTPAPTITALPASSIAPPLPPGEAPPAPARKARPHPPVEAAAPAPESAAAPDDELAREVALLRQARGALQRGDASAAWLALEDHQRDFANGQLIEEAGALTIETLCALGRDDAAARAREDFLIRWPGSAQRARVERPCHLEDTDAP